MNLLRTLKHIATIFICVFTFGCSTTLFELPLMEDKEQVNKTDVTTSNETEKIEQEIQNLELIETHKMLLAHLDEWGSLKGDISRILELESELAFLVGALKQQDELVMLSKPDDLLGEFTEPDLLLIDKQQNKETNNAIVKNDDLSVTEVNEDGVNQNKFSMNGQTAVQTFAAPQLPVSSIAIDAGVNKSKFSNASFSPSKQSERAPTITADSVQSCQPNYNEIGNYALHLISVSKEDKIQEAKTSVLEKFSNKLCGKYLKIAKVRVSDTDFNSLRFGPYENKVDAQNVCSEIQARGEYCSVAPFKGDILK